MISVFYFNSEFKMLRNDFRFCIRQDSIRNITGVLFYRCSVVGRGADSWRMSAALARVKSSDSTGLHPHAHTHCLGREITVEPISRTAGGIVDRRCSPDQKQ